MIIPSYWSVFEELILKHVEYPYDKLHCIEYYKIKSFGVFTMSSFKRKMSPLAGFPKNIYKVVTSIMEILIMTITVVANHLLTKPKKCTLIAVSNIWHENPLQIYRKCFGISHMWLVVWLFIYTLSVFLIHELFNIFIDEPYVHMVGKVGMVHAGEKLHLNCTATGIPKPDISWYRNKKKLQKSKYREILPLKWNFTHR